MFPPIYFHLAHGGNGDPLRGCLYCRRFFIPKANLDAAIQRNIKAVKDRIVKHRKSTEVFERCKKV